jgi:TolA-binding protein
MQNIQYKANHYWILLVIHAFIVAVMMASCAPVEESVFPKKDIVLVETEQKNPFEPAMQAFEAGRYAEAEDAFKAVLESSSDGLTQRKAKYGMACSALAGAQDDIELKQALQLWEKWALNVPEYLKNEDPRLLYPVLKDYYLQFSSQVKKLKQECDVLQKEKSQWEKKRQKLTSRLNQMEEENQSLQEKIEALEKLRQDLLNRRKKLEK